MLKYKVRTAFLTKSVLRYCDHCNFSVPDEYDKYRWLEDSDHVRFNVLNDLLLTIERGSGDKFFVFDMFRFLSVEWGDYFLGDLNDAETKAQRIVEYFEVYKSNYSNLNWSLTECATGVTLSNPISQMNHISKYEDLMLFYLARSSMLNCIDDNADVEVMMPFSRDYHIDIVNLSHGVGFDNRCASIFVHKTKEQVQNNERLIVSSSNCNIQTYEMMMAAAHCIPFELLDVNSLSFTIGVSPKTLQRQLKKDNLSLRLIVNNEKTNRAKKILRINDGNVKKTAYDCGYTNPSGLAKSLNRM
ncbi:hypothetical protein [Shewanella sp. 6_MG-2023]|uniref:hypothetical protein n=1 Tax=Shewanella sp. 6_MG-2023 TaxID=3062660 RepID=UPI0026E2AC44|nr:hypothetical protein [Shewanella sp. 6_MG-2023]MDO6619702.1 hypothetical protein [Shewanella sp. 6_MG-2023]